MGLFEEVSFPIYSQVICAEGLQSEDQGYFTEEAGVLAQRWTMAKDQIPAAEVSFPSTFDSRVSV